MISENEFQRTPNWIVFFVMISLVQLVALPTVAQESSLKSGATKNEIAKVSKDFEKAYNSGDAEGIAKLFLEQGEYVSVEKVVYSGNVAILEEFKAGFAANKGKKLTVTSESVRKVSSTLAIEDGIATVTGSNGEVFVSDFCATYSLVDGAWKIASLRDLKSVPATPGENLLQIKWLIGDWISESTDGVVEHDYFWSEDGNFILGTFSVTVDGKALISGTRRIGWDAQQQVIRAWTFDSEGGHSQGTWHPTDDGWMIRSRGITSDGKTGTSINYYEIKDGKTLSWRSTNRVVDGKQTDPIRIEMVKRPPKPASDAKATKQ